MIEKIVTRSTNHRFFVGIGIILIIIGVTYSIMETPVDSIPDLSENQVIVYTEWMGRNPKIMENQITYPLVANLQGIPCSYLIVPVRKALDLYEMSANEWIIVIEFSLATLGVIQGLKKMNLVL